MAFGDYFSDLQNGQSQMKNIVVEHSVAKKLTFSHGRLIGIHAFKLNGRSFYHYRLLVVT